MDKKTELGILKSQARSLGQLAYSAGQMRNARQFGRLNRQLETTWRQIDKLAREIKNEVN